MKILQQVKADWGTASLTFSVRKGKTKATLEVELDSEPEPSAPLHLQLHLALADAVDDVLGVLSSKGPHQGLPHQLLQ